MLFYEFNKSTRESSTEMDRNLKGHLLQVAQNFESVLCAQTLRTMAPPARTRWARACGSQTPATVRDTVDNDQGLMH